VIRHFLNPPNWFTSASIFCSVYALSSLMSGETVTSAMLVRACVLVVFGAIFDLLDGRVARLTNRYSAFGVQLDSIADIIGFGVAPALIAWTWCVHELGTLGIVCTVWYVLTAAFRLARFNVATEEGTWPYEGHSQGLTSTMAGGILVTLTWVANGYFSDRLTIPPVAVAAVVGLLGYLMVSSIPFRNFRDMRRNAVARRYLAVTTAACLAGAFLFDPSMWFGVGAALYLVLGLLDGLVVAAIGGHLVPALLGVDSFDEETATEAP